MARKDASNTVSNAPEVREFKSDAEQLAALRVPFPITEVRTREQGGATLHYYEAYTIQQRLLDVLGTGMTVKTGQVITTESNVNVEVILEIEWVSGKRSTVTGWGSSDILVSNKSGKIMNDPYKTATTDGIKVAASKLGVAGELYDSKYREGLKVRLAALEEEEAERLFLTCQDCGGEINPGEVTKPDGNSISLTAKEVATSTRKKFGQRLCIGCADKRRGQ